MSELGEVSGIIKEALPEGWGSFAAVLLTMVLALFAAFSRKKWWHKRSKSKNMEHRQEAQASNSADNKSVSEDQSESEDEVERLLKED